MWYVEVIIMDVNLPIIDHSVIVAPVYLHAFFLRERAKHPFADIKLYSKEDLLKAAFFDYDDRAIVFLMKEENIKYETARIFLDNLYFLPTETSKDESIAKLQDIKTTLERENLLIFDKYFSKGIANRKIIVYGYPKEDCELISVLKRLGMNYEIYPMEYDKKNLAVAHFETIEEETRFAFNQIGKLISEGTSVDDIYFYNPPNEYEYLLQKMAKFYGVPLITNGKSTLNTTKTGLQFLSLLKVCGNAEESLEKLDVSDADEFFSMIANIVSRYKSVRLSKELLYDFYKNIMKSTYLPIDSFTHAVRFSDSVFYDNNAAVFILGFNEGNFPDFSKDIDYLNDSRKANLGRLTSTQVNEINENVLINFLYSPVRIFLSYKDKSLSNIHYKSPLIDRLGMEVVASPSSAIDYGNQWSAIRLASFLDSLKQYQSIHPELASFKKQLNPPYCVFDHHFYPVTAFKPDDLIKYSYSSVKTFYQCQFKYYMENVLRLDPFEDNFYTKFGKLAHTVLERKYGANFDFDRVFDEEQSHIDFDDKENAIIIRLKEDLRNVVKFNEDHENHMLFLQALCEYRPSYMLSKYAKLNGSLDKVIISGDSTQQFISLIDYKTGNEEFNSSLIKCGYSLQLPNYALLAGNDEKLKDKEIIGLYIQKIIPNKLVRPSGSDAEKFYYDQLKLGGLSTDDTIKLRTFDSGYAASRFIKTIRVTKDNAFYKTSKVASPKVFEQLKEEAKNKVLEADALIRKNDFKINPKKIDNLDTPCKYCSFRDVCFRTDDDIISLRTKEANTSGEVD
ncbi:MAG: PD-(D/E)XK nuclease family protein [Firmicutes bacterium]|nr:PD-(D/E)XK nuclease family protein [Bacillota bacterium]